MEEWDKKNAALQTNAAMMGATMESASEETDPRTGWGLPNGRGPGDGHDQSGGVGNHARDRSRGHSRRRSERRSRERSMMVRSRDRSRDRRHHSENARSRDPSRGRDMRRRGREESRERSVRRSRRPQRERSPPSPNRTPVPQRRNDLRGADRADEPRAPAPVQHPPSGPVIPTAKNLALAMELPTVLIDEVLKQMGGDSNLTIKDFANIPESMFASHAEKIIMGGEPISPVLVGKAVQWRAKAAEMMTPTAPTAAQGLPGSSSDTMVTLAPTRIKRQGVLEQKDDTLYEDLSEEAIAAMRGVFFQPMRGQTN